MTLSEALLELAVSRIGMKETTRNRGREIDEYAASVGLDPVGAYAWCTSGMYWLCRMACQKMGLVNPFPKTASALSFWRHVEPICKSQNPTPGAIYVLQHSETTGHLGIVESCDGGNVLTEISGNTFGDVGGRDGNQWARHTGQPEVTHGGVLLGYADLSLAAQPPAGFA